MIIDTSALIAIARRESGADDLIDALDEAPIRRVSAASLFEAFIVVDGAREAVLSGRFDDFLRAGESTIEPVTEAQVRIARQAYRDFGKGSGHPAQLNFGDCFAYALARETGEALLFVGKDFAQTDVEPALG